MTKEEVEPRTSRALTTAFVALGTLVFLGILAAGIGLAASASEVRRRIEADRKARAEDEAGGDRLRARLLARGGIEAALVQVRECLRAGRPLPLEIENDFGHTKPKGIDRYKVKIAQLADGSFAVECLGEVVYASGSAAASSTQKCTARVSKDKIEIIAIAD